MDIYIAYKVSRNMILGSSTFVKYGYFIDVSFGYVVICLLEVKRNNNRVGNN